MCGITATITLRRGKPGSDANGYITNGHGDHSTLHKQLNESLETIAHRGPDASGIWISEDGTIGTEPWPWHGFWR